MLDGIDVFLIASEENQERSFREAEYYLRAAMARLRVLGDTTGIDDLYDEGLKIVQERGTVLDE